MWSGVCCVWFVVLALLFQRLFSSRQNTFGLTAATRMLAAATRLARGLGGAAVPMRNAGCCHWFAPSAGGDEIWQVDVSTIKYGRGALRELGQDAEMQNMKKVAIFTDKHQRNLPHLKTATEALEKQKIEYTVFDEVTCEPTSTSFMNAAKFASVCILPFPLSFPFSLPFPRLTLTPHHVAGVCL